jgi:hypothetical protein
MRNSVLILRAAEGHVSKEVAHAALDRLRP